MQILLAIILIGTISSLLYLNHDRFGAKATGARLAKMKSKPNYKNGSFENLEHTPALAEGTSFLDIFKTFFLGKDKRNVPKDKIPVIKNNLKQLSIYKNLYVWFGHSSYLLQLDGKKILVDPVFSKYATPVRVSIRKFKSEYDYSTKDMPEIDILVITHDHWD